jgi:hypothetical protein
MTSRTGTGSQQRGLASGGPEDEGRRTYISMKLCAVKPVTVRALKYKVPGRNEGGDLESGTPG